MKDAANTSSAAAGRLSICLVAHNAYRALTGLGEGHLGGVERQTAIMARWLAARGHQVSVLIWDQGAGAVREVDGIRLISICPSNSGWPLFRLIHPRVTGLMRAMRAADADVYYHNCAEALTGVIARWARAHGKKFVFSVASDSDVDPRLPEMGRSYERWLFRTGLKRAHRIFVQTARQQRALAASFGVEGKVLPMPCPGPEESAFDLARPAGPPRVAWVGRIDTMKRLEWLLDIAERMPDIQFDVVAANMGVALQHPHLAGYATQLRQRAGSMANVAWHGTVPHEKLAEIYRAALCLCCTSTYEGFPNTFLEAWSQGRPVVSSFDPDGLIQSRQLGAYATQAGEFVAAIRNLVQLPEAWHEQAQRSREYFLSTHAPAESMPRFEREFLDAAEMPGQPGPHPVNSTLFSA